MMMRFLHQWIHGQLLVVSFFNIDERVVGRAILEGAGIIIPIIVISVLEKTKN